MKVVIAGTTHEIADGTALPDRRFRDAWRHDGTTIVIDQAAALTQTKAALTAKVDAEAERRRERVSTTYVGKSHEYAFLALEAAAVISGEAANANLLTRANYPLLAASIGVDVPNTGNDATDLTAAAQVIHTKRGAMYAAFAAIRAARLKGAAAIAAATSVSAADAAYAAVQWPAV